MHKYDWHEISYLVTAQFEYMRELWNDEQPSEECELRYHERKKRLDDMGIRIAITEDGWYVKFKENRKINPSILIRAFRRSHL